MRTLRDLKPEDLRLRFTPAVVEVFKDVYGEKWVEALMALMTPARRFFLRVNTLKASVEDVLKSLDSRGLRFRQHRLIEEAIYMEVERAGHLPIPEKTVMVDRWAAETVLQGANLYVPGIIRYPKDLEAGDTVGVVDPYGLLVGVGVSMVSAEQLKRLKKGLAVKITHSWFKLPSTADLPERAQGLVYPQSLPSIVTVRVLDPQPGETIVDMCAAPGGKLTHIAMLTKGRGTVYGFDKSSRKVGRMRELLRLMGIRNVRVGRMDSRYIDLEMPGLEADRVLIDPPCSALGVRPKLGSELGEDELDNFPRYQRQFLKPASKILKKGGVLVFSVCTITRREIEGILEYAVENLPFEPAEHPVFIGSEGLGRMGRYVQRFHPHIHDTPGFGIVLLRKI